MDAIEEWSAARQRVADLVRGTGHADHSVPACPDWTVHDLLAHMVGLGADVVAEDEPDDHNTEWTQRQVAARADRSIGELLAEWDEVAEPLRAWMRTNTIRPLNDVIIHEQDLRGALGGSGARDTDGLRIVRDRMAGAFADRVGPLPAIALLGEKWQWASAGAPDDAPVAVRAGDFDLARALTSRRTAAQLTAWTERGDVGPYLDAFARLGPLPETELSD